MDLAHAQVNAFVATWARLRLPCSSTSRGERNLVSYATGSDDPLPGLPGARLALLPTAGSDALLRLYHFKLSERLQRNSGTTATTPENTVGPRVSHLPRGGEKHST
jgi:hypothetical protein